MVGLRRALVLLILSFFFIQLAVISFLGPDEAFWLYMGLSACYGVAFFGLAAEWFWARWFATGLGNFGSVFLLLCLQMGPEPILLFFGGTHALITVLLMGEGMAARYEHSEQTRERWNFQEESLVLMRRAFKSAGSTLPLLVLYFLAPKPETLQLLVLGLAGASAVGLARGKTWGLLPLGGLAAVAFVHGCVGAQGISLAGAPFVWPSMLLGATPAVAFGAAMVAFVPLSFAPAVGRWLRADG